MKIAYFQRRRRNWIMRPDYWRPPIELSATEQTIIKRIRRAKLFVFLRQHRHEVFDEAFQQELAILYRESQRGQPPVPPALLALATILQAYTGVSDDEVVEASTMDRRWQLVLDCVDTEKPATFLILECARTLPSGQFFLLHRR